MASSRPDHDGRPPDELRRAAKERGRRLVRRRRRATRAAVAVAAAVGTGVLVVLITVGPRSSVPGSPGSGQTPTSPPAAGPTTDASALAGHGRLAFVSRGELYVVDGSSGAVRQVTKGSPPPSSPAFSHDGTWLAFVRRASGADGGRATLWIARGDGTKAHRVTTLPPADPVPNSAAPAFSWSPTSDDLLVTTSQGDTAVSVPRQVWIVPAAGAPRRLLGPGYTNGAVWSPDGARVAVLWSSHGLSDESLEILPADGDGPPTTWLAAGTSTYYLAGWAPGFGILVWDDSGNGGPSVENFGLPLAFLAAPGAQISVLATSPLFEAPALAIGPPGHLALVANGDDSQGGGEGEKFAWFGKTVETCTPPSGPCSPVADAASSVTLDPALSRTDGSLAFVEAPQSDAGLPPHYAPSAPWSQLAGWYGAHTLWVDPGGNGTPTAIAGTAGASDPVWSSHGGALLYEADGALWLLPSVTSPPVEVASPVSTGSASPTGDFLFGYADWSDQFAWSG